MNDRIRSLECGIVDELTFAVEAESATVPEVYVALTRVLSRVDKQLGADGLDTESLYPPRAERP